MQKRTGCGESALLREFFAQLPSLPFDDSAIENYGEIRGMPCKSRQPIGANDLLITSVAKNYRITLVTHSRCSIVCLKHFKSFHTFIAQDFSCPSIA
jgi:predicted nucleic acid-binding protein